MVVIACFRFGQGGGGPAFPGQVELAVAMASLNGGVVCTHAKRDTVCSMCERVESPTHATREKFWRYAVANSPMTGVVMHVQDHSARRHERFMTTGL